MGARPMARIIQEHIKRPLAEELLFGKLVNGGQVDVTVSEDGEKLKLESRPADASPALLSHERRRLSRIESANWRPRCQRPR